MGGMPLRCAVFPDTHNLCCYKQTVKASEQPLFLYSVHSDDVLVLAAVQFLHEKKEAKKSQASLDHYYCSSKKSSRLITESNKKAVLS